MARKKRLIIPIFIPFGGCPHQCVFCDQAGITGRAIMPGPEDVRATIEAYLSTWKGEGPREAAFYGGSFTGLPMEKQEEYLACAHAYVRDGRLDSIRLSTRPDYIDAKTAAFLKAHGAGTVELGVQSMSDEVLRLSGRGHTAEDSRRATGMLKEAEIKAGAQIMPGLPGDTAETIVSTVKDVVAFGPDFVRIYPTLVLKDTPLYAMYLRGAYRPWPLDEMVETCREASALLKAAGIPVIRMGLQPTEELAGSIVCGPYHPSFRQLVEGC